MISFPFPLEILLRTPVPRRRHPHNNTGAPTWRRPHGVARFAAPTPLTLASAEKRKRLYQHSSARRAAS